MPPEHPARARAATTKAAPAARILLVFIDTPWVKVALGSNAVVISVVLRGPRALLKRYPCRRTSQTFAQLHPRRSRLAYESTNTSDESLAYCLRYRNGGDFGRK